MAVSKCRPVASIVARQTTMGLGLSEFARRRQCAEIGLGLIAVTDGVNVVRECSNCDPNYLMASSLFVPGHVAFEV